MRIAVCHIAINDAQHLLLQQHGGYGHFSIFCANLHEKKGGFIDRLLYFIIINGITNHRSHCPRYRS